jgi:hypothetical protein
MAMCTNPTSRISPAHFVIKMPFTAGILRFAMVHMYEY